MNARRIAWGAVLLALGGRADAAKTCSPEAQWKVAKAADCLDRKDSGCAKLALEPVLAREPNCAEALLVQGFILQYYDLKVEAGEAMRARAVTLNPELESFWEKRARHIESRLSSQEFSRFDLQYDGAENRQKAWQAVKYLNDMYTEMTSVFALAPSKRIPVIVLATFDYIDTWRMPFTGGFYDKKDGKVRIRVDEMPGGDEEFRHRARHEFIHAYLYDLYPRDLPAWASEGIAEFYARANPAGGFWKDIRLEQIRKLSKGYEKFSLAKIQETIDKKKGTVMSMQLAYLYAEALVLFIAKERGDSWIPRVILHLREHGGTFEQAFETVLSLTPAVAMERLRRAWE